MKKFIYTLLISFMGLTAYSQDGVLDIIANSDDHNTLEAAVIASGLAGDLSGGGPFAIFAPTDAAFAALPAGTIETLLMDPMGELADILRGHIVGANLISIDITDGLMAPTFAGTFITAEVNADGIFINGAQIIMADIMASNGWVHVIDAVILPEPPLPATVVDIIVDSEDHTTLEAAVIAAELDDDLSGAGPFTVFAPTDDAFAALPAGTVDDLLMDPTGDLAQILLYHVVSGNVLSTDLSDGMTATTLEMDDVTVTIDGSDVFINDAQVIIADIEAENGVVHVLDAVLLPGFITSSTDVNADLGLEVFPNPTTDYININLDLDNSSDVELSIFNLSGQMLETRTLQVATGQWSNKINTQNFDAGMYFLEVKQENKFQTLKFTVK